MTQTIEERRARDRKYYETHREERRAANRKYCETHREEIRDRGRKYREEHREEYRASQRKYREEHREELRAHKRAHAESDRAYLHAAKDKPCLDCGGRFHPAAMDFHHRDPATKEFTVGQRSRRPLWRVQAEIAKCDLICSNCHRVRHHACSDVE